METTRHRRLRVQRTGSNTAHGRGRNWSTAYSIAIAMLILCAYIAGYIWLYVLTPSAATVVLGVHLVVIALVIIVGMRHREKDRDDPPGDGPPGAARRPDDLDLTEHLDLRPSQPASDAGTHIAPVVRLDRARSAHGAFGRG